MRCIFFFVFISLFPVVFSSGQCPDRDGLWKRLVFLRDSPSTLSQAEKLNELLAYDIKIKNCPYKFDSTHALLLQRIGAMYFLQSDYLKATHYTQQAIRIINENADKPSVNMRHNIKNYYNLGWFYDSLGNVSEKMKAYDSCISVAMRFKSPDIYCLRSLMEKVEHFFDVGDYQRCINYSTLFERVSLQYANNDNKQLGLQYMLTSLFWKVNALIKFKDYETAEKLLADKIAECKKTGLKTYLGTIYQELADLQIKRGNYEKAILNYNLALKNEEEAGDNISCMVILSNMGYEIYFKHYNDLNRALVYCKKGLAYGNKEKSQNISGRFESLNVLDDLGNLYAQRELYDSAFFYFQLALNQIKPGLNETALLNSSIEEFSKHKHMHYLSDLLLNEGDAFKQQYKTTKENSALNKALKIYKITDRLLDRIKMEQTELQSKLFWRSDSRRLYEHAVDACYLQNNASDAFYFFEKSRSVLLSDQLNEQRWLDENDLFKQAQLKKQILAKERELNSSDKTSGHYADLEKEIFSDKLELERLQDQIKAKNPLYYQNFLDSNFISIPDVRRNILKDHQAVIEIFSGDSAVYLLAITMQQIFLKKIDKNAFDKLSSDYISFISQAGVLNKNFESFADVSHGLYQLLFQNIHLPAGRIIISPGGKYFPFEALVISRQPLNYFLEDYAVSYTYSARYLLNDFKENSVNSNGFMGVAPVQYTNGLPQLSGSDQSIQRMQGYFSNTASFVGNKATRNNFLNEFYKYKVIQLYTHATDSGYTGEPMIYFSDSALALSYLLPEKRPATVLIVLSACETASGKLYNGEGVFSFNRQFAALGIPSSVSNLWQVDNQSTYQLTELFYKYVSDGMPLDLALQKAKIEFIKTTTLDENKLPYYWAASILIGKTNEISIQKKSEWKWIAGLALLVSIVFVTWILRRKKIFQN